MIPMAVPKLIPNAVDGDEGRAAGVGYELGRVGGGAGHVFARRLTKPSRGSPRIVHQRVPRGNQTNHEPNRKVTGLD